MATTSKEQICNLALSHIGAKSTIQTLTENSPPAKACRQWYDIARQEILEAFNWSFARLRIDLALHADAAPNGWGYRYQHPSNCLAPRLIYNPIGLLAAPIPFEMGISLDGSTKCILTNLEEAELIYTFDQVNVYMFEPRFVNALSFLLASKFSYSLTGKRTLRGEMLKGYDFERGHAEASDASKKTDDPPRDAPWIEGRN